MRLLERVLEAQAKKMSSVASMLQRISLREREGKTDTGTEALMEQRCFILHSVGIYTVLEGSCSQQR